MDGQTLSVSHYSPISLGSVIYIYDSIDLPSPLFFYGPLLYVFKFTVFFWSGIKVTLFRCWSCSRVDIRSSWTQHMVSMKTMTCQNSTRKTGWSCPDISEENDGILCSCVSPQTWAYDITTTKTANVLRIRELYSGPEGNSHRAHYS